MPDLLFFLLLGHFFGDYALQTDKMAKHKGASKTVLSAHVFVYTLVVGFSWWLGKILNNQTDFFRVVTLIVLALLYIEHWLQDYVKFARMNGSKQGYYFDQALHVSLLYIIRIFF